MATIGDWSVDGMMVFIYRRWHANNDDIGFLKKSEVWFSFNFREFLVNFLDFFLLCTWADHTAISLPLDGISTWICVDSWYTSGCSVWIGISKSGEIVSTIIVELPPEFDQSSASSQHPWLICPWSSTVESGFCELVNWWTPIGANHKTLAKSRGWLLILLNYLVWRQLGS